MNHLHDSDLSQTRNSLQSVSSPLISLVESLSSIPIIFH
jgi:hypothetical protein